MNKPVFKDKFLKKQVILMEDNPTIRESIIESIKNDMNWEVKTVNSKEEAVNLAQQQEAAYYILDAHMGRTRDQEGITALERIKQIDSKTMVIIVSAYQKNKRLAQNLNADIFLEKTGNLKKDIREEIAPKILEFRLQHLKLQEEYVEIEMKDTRAQLEKLYRKEEDKNMIAYQQLKAEKFNEYKGKYVAFVNGSLVETADTEKEGQELLEKLMTLPEYHNQSKFFAQVTLQNLMTIDQSSYDTFENFDAF